MTRYALFDSDGFPQGFYSSDIHGNGIPKNAIKITDAQWIEFIDNAGLRKWDGLKVDEYVPPVPEPETVITVIPAVTLWERMTEAEAEQVAEVMKTQSVRTVQIFNNATTFRSDHELWPLLEQIAHDLFGAARASELLAP